MSKHIKITGSPQTRIRTAGDGQSRVDVAQVAAALGAEPLPGSIEGNPGPMTLYALRSELLRRRLSSGGRPGITGTSQRLKIPLSNQDWTELEGLAGELAGAAFSPSPGQIASVLLHVAIQSVKRQAGEMQSEGKLAEAIARELVASASLEQRN